ncbi:alpha-D-ribose 1-methylphosphonate 5-triphosphate synthase subunit PhnH [Dinghuibacter silviterrae]|uniref:Alpha-D-ribose 1-methylphosphonate 5-triphosphate synthase subunit PhnH n=2 Tax=Dinghuibacter silviterrae TaxID=1539049 RepID=A0A4V3GLU1_9BACT|nr:alpha-D-ribose 1-methylphosphonate 5-triphosphate synthase subunit PhnH [Dinghuibacter silviterrae]
MYDSVFDAQEHFRILLDCMARPGTVRVLPIAGLHPPEGLHPAAALVGFALLNADVSFFASPLWQDYLRENTDAVASDAPDADFLFVGGALLVDGEAAALIAQARTGTLTYPEGGATVVVCVERVAVSVGAAAAPAAAPHPAASTIPAADAAPTAALVLSLTGPGIERVNELSVLGLTAEFLETLREQNREFPLGIDLILADAGGRIAAIPRSTKVQWD